MKLVEEIRLNPTDTMPSQLKVNGVAYNVTQDYEKAKLASKPVAVCFKDKWYLVSKYGLCPVGDAKPNQLPKTEDVLSGIVERWQTFVASFDKPRERKHEDPLLLDLMEELERQHPPIAPLHAETYIAPTHSEDKKRVNLDSKAKSFEEQVRIPNKTR